MKNKKGIALLTLVVSVIVVIILAAIVVSLTLGSNGLVEHAKKTVVTAEEKELIENLKEIKLAREVKNKGREYTLEQFKSDIEKGEIEGYRVVTENEKNYIQKEGLNTKYEITTTLNKTSENEKLIAEEDKLILEFSKDDGYYESLDTISLDAEVMVENGDADGVVVDWGNGNIESMDNNNTTISYVYDSENTTVPKRSWYPAEIEGKIKIYEKKKVPGRKISIRMTPSDNYYRNRLIVKNWGTLNKNNMLVLYDITGIEAKIKEYHLMSGDKLIEELKEAGVSPRVIDMYRNRTDVKTLGIRFSQVDINSEQIAEAFKELRELEVVTNLFSHSFPRHQHIMRDFFKYNPRLKIAANIFTNMGTAIPDKSIISNNRELISVANFYNTGAGYFKIDKNMFSENPNIIDFRGVFSESDYLRGGLDLSRHPGADIKGAKVLEHPEREDDSHGYID